MRTDTDNRRARFVGQLSAKLIGCLLILICFAVGAVGLVLPIIPGLLFVAIALMLIAQHFPSIDRRLRRNRTIRSYLERADGFSALSVSGKIRFGLLLCLQLFIDAVACIVFVVARVLGFAVGKYQAYR